MKTLIQSVSLALALLLLYIMGNGFSYSLSENEAAIITQFGQPIGKPVTEPGLHYIWPFVQSVNRIDLRMQEWDGQAVDMPTRDKLYIVVDSFGRWRVSDPTLYFTRLRDTRSALSRIDDIAGSELRNAVAGNNLIEMVRTDKTRQPALDVPNTNDAFLVSSTLAAITFGRAAVEKQMTDRAAAKLKDFGIELRDVRIMRLNYDPSVSAKINERMISERQQIAARFRSEGEGAAARIMGNKERDLAEITSAAYEKIEEIKGRAEAESTETYAKAYDQSPESRDLYGFLRTMETYKKIASNDTTIVMTTDGELFRYLKRPETIRHEEADSKTSR